MFPVCEAPLQGCAPKTHGFASGVSLEGRVWNRAVVTYSYDREGNRDAFQVSKGKGSGDAFQANYQVERSPLNPDNVTGSLGVSTAGE